MINCKIKNLVFVLVIIGMGIGYAPTLVFSQTVDAGFDPNKLVDDVVFSDTQTFGGASGIQKFLESKSSVLANTTPEFLAKLKEPTVALLKTGLEDPEPTLPRLRTAAELIWDVSQAAGINPQVILVTLQKEQGLITTRQNDPADRLQRALDFAMGFDCPDSTGCGTLFPGFYFQLFGNIDASGNRYLGAAKALIKSFNTPGGRGPAVNGVASKVGDIIELDNTLGAYDGIPAKQTVMLQNRATAALYRYTPHVFNGNYNFQKYFLAWFRYPNGTIMAMASDPALYIIQNGSRLVLPSFVAVARALNVAQTITVSPTEVASYPVGGVYGPADNTIVTVTGEAQKYVFIDNIKHPASDFVIAQRKLDTAKALTVSAGESSLFTAGDVLTPADGTVVRGKTLPEVYLVESGKLKLYSAFTFGQYGVAKKVQLVPDAEIALYTKAGFVTPKDGTLVKSANDGTVYEIKQSTKHPVSAAVFKNRGMSIKSVAVLAPDEVSSFALDGYAEPRDRTFFKAADSAQLYYFRDGTKRTISSFVAKQQHITSDFTFSRAEADSWADGIAVPPRDGTYVKGDASQDVYVVAKGQLHPITYAVYLKRKLAPKKISVLPQSEVDAYAKGDVIVK